MSYNDTMKLSSKHQKTLAAIFKDPVSSTLTWTAVERLLGALGAETSEGRGSRVRVHLNGVRAVFHRPHPHKELNKGTVRSLGRYLLEAGVRPEERNSA